MTRTVRAGDVPGRPGARYALTLDAGTLRLTVARVWPLSPGEQAPEVSEEVPTTAGVVARAVWLAEGLPRLQPFGVVAYDGGVE